MKNYGKYVGAQTILEDMHGDNISGSMITGFNNALSGHDEVDFINERNGYVANSYRNLAVKMITDGLIYFIYPFKCACGNSRYFYGGGWACDRCQNCINTPEWWKVKVQPDGDSFICTGNGFVDLQESSNYAYGESRDSAMENYRLLMLPSPPKKGEKEG